MGFNKRFININNLILVYQDSGISSLINYCTKPDMLMVNMTDNSRYIVDCICKGDIFGAELILKYELNKN